MEELFGKEIIQSLSFENPFYEDLQRLMQNNGFREFSQKYFQNHSDIETVLLYIKFYEYIEKEYVSKYNQKPTSQTVISIIHLIMNDRTARRNLMNSYESFQNGFRDFSFLATQQNKKKILHVENKKDSPT